MDTDAGIPQRNISTSIGIPKTVKFSSPIRENINKGPAIGCNIAVSLLHNSGSDVGIVKSLAFKTVKTNV